MNEGLKDFINAVGALAEMMRLFREELMKNGFTRREAIQLVQTFMVEQISQKPKEEN